MLNIKKQIRNIYAISAFGSFQIAGASWVVLLAARGFSLIEIGIAESVFHVASLLFEIPSGVISDVFGRKKSMIMSQCMFIISALFMMLSESMAGVYLALVLDALGYNFASGAREALAYDSLKKAGEEERYDKYASTEMMIYRIGNASATLCAGLALVLGYKKAYFIDIVLGILCLYFSFSLKEVRVGERKSGEKVSKRIFGCVKESVGFLIHNHKATRLMLWNAFIGAIATLVCFFLQAELKEAGVDGSLLGPALFIIGLGGAAGAKLVQYFSGWKYSKISVMCIVGVVLGAISVVTGNPLIMCLGGFMASLFDDLLQVRSDILLNQMIPSSQRATLISVASLCFSVVMIVLSPAMGVIFEML